MKYDDNTPYKELTENLKRVKDAYGVLLEMIDDVFYKLDLQGRLTEEEFDYLEETINHLLRKYLNTNYPDWKHDENNFARYKKEIFLRSVNPVYKEKYIRKFITVFLFSGEKKIDRRKKENKNIQPDFTIQFIYGDGSRLFNKIFTRGQLEALKVETGNQKADDFEMLKIIADHYISTARANSLSGNELFDLVMFKELDMRGGKNRAQ